MTITKYFTRLLNNFSIIHFRSCIIIRFNCYQQPNQVLGRQRKLNRRNFLQTQDGFYTQVCFANSPWLLIFYLSAPLPTLRHYRGNRLTHLMLITAFYLIRSEGHREPSDEVGSISPAEWVVGFELGTFRFQLQPFNPLGHSPLCRELKKFIAWDMTVLSIMMKGYQSFLVVRNCTSKFVFIDRRSSNSEYPASQGCDKDLHLTSQTKYTRRQRLSLTISGNP